ncbi:oligoendopeptidase F [[Mycoplasma] anseris]|uniref:Oligopeptidase F n=1 Tax=[Mycoplasma] anseris TaxID=92400 RepID=A0A2Z4NDD4_9BACT|nr:oligoendopeptidase F [[Mycoplasma] anseris]AWX69604.1 oligoendopeptidase F [[Mycoplasma] anseris]
MKKYNSYLEIEEQYRFDLEDILENKSYQEWEDQYFLIFKQLIEIKDKKYEDLDLFLKGIKLTEQLIIIGNKLQNYLENNINVNLSNTKFIELRTRFETKNNEYEIEMGNEINRIAKHRKTIEKWINLNELKNVKKDLLATLEVLDHKLGDEVEEYINKTSMAQPDLEEIFTILTDSETDYGYAISKSNKKFKITEATRMSLMKSKDEKIRKSTFINYANAFYKRKETLSKLLYQHFKRISVLALNRGYQSSMDSILSEDKIDKKLLDTIYNSIQKNMGIFKKFATARKRFFEKKFNKKMQLWDQSLDLVNVKNKYSVEEAKEILLKITEIMPFEYHDVVKKALDEKWVDFMHCPNKISGAYSIGNSYGLNKKYILMNFDYTFESVNTLCHEMGHSLHSYFSDKTQPLQRSGYPIFLAEIASIFNELLLNDYLISKAKTEKEQFYLLERSIFDFIGTVIKQAEWSNYEYDLYNLIDQDEPLNSFDALEKLYVNNSNKYKFNNTNKIGNKHNIYSVIVPHFYYHFYVYKYALGYIVANVFFQRYKKEGKSALENYVLNFLSAGDRDWPAIILKEAGIDIYNENIYNEAFKIIEEKINKYIKLGKRIFKITK